MNTLKTDDGTLLKSVDLFAVGLRARYETWKDLKKTLAEGELFAYGIDFEEARQVYKTN
jgi:hypothetical protein